MSKRPDYGDATPEDVALALLTSGRRTATRSSQSDRGRATASDQTRRHPDHLRQRILVPRVVLPRELLDVAIQVLRTKLVERALVRPLQHAPEALNAIV